MGYSAGDYTPHERRLLALLDGTPVDSKRIAELLYAGREAPTFPRNTVVVSMNRLRLKVIRRRERFRIMKTRRAGAHPIQYWIVKRSAARA